MSEWPRCAEVRDLIPELAMGVAPGDERAAALTHIATCADCRRALEEASAVVDELLLLAPEHDPAPGFDARVIEAAGIERPSRWRKVSKYALAAAALVLVAVSAVGLTRWAGADDRQLAAQYRETLREAHGSYFRAATLGNEQDPAGHVFAYQGNPSWVFVTMEDAPSGNYRVRYVTEDGRTDWIGVCRVRDGSGSWGTALDVPLYTVDRVDLVHHGSTLTADFS